MEFAFETLKKELALMGMEATDDRISQFRDYYELLLEWNKKMNLTVITELNEVIQKHFLDSAALGKYCRLNQHLSLADVGSGAGFPGIPLKILFPELEVILMDSVGKRVTFMKEVISQLGLQKIEAVHGRAEDLARAGEYREKFDFCVSRAVADLSSLVEYCLPFVKIDGLFVAYKSANVEEEIERAGKAIQLLGGRLDKKEEFQIPNSSYRRTFLFIQKIHQTKNKYPRKAGTPTKMPLA